MLSYGNFLTLGGAAPVRPVGSPRWWNTSYQPASPSHNGAFSNGPVLGRKYTNGGTPQQTSGYPISKAGSNRPSTLRTYRNTSF